MVPEREDSGEIGVRAGDDGAAPPRDGHGAVPPNAVAGPPPGGEGPPPGGEGPAPGGFVGSTDPSLRESLYHTPAWHEAAQVEAPMRVSGIAAQVLWGAAWVIVAILGLVAAQRVIWFDRTATSATLSAYTFFLFVPAWVIVVVAALRTRWWLAGAAFTLVVLHLVWLLPTVPAASRAPVLSPTNAQQLEIYSASLDPDHDDPASLVDAIAASDAHILVLREYTPAWAEVVRADERLTDRFPNRVEEPREGRAGIAVLSDRSLADVEVLEAAGRPFVRVGLSLGVGRARTARSVPVRLVAVNVVSPSEDFDLHVRQFDRIRALVDAEEDTGREVVVVGGFQSTQFNRQLQRLEGAGLASVHELRGRGFARTYPNGTGLSMPRVRYDHVMVSRRFIVLAASETDGPGTEHRPVVTRIAIDATTAERVGAAAGADVDLRPVGGGVDP